MLQAELAILRQRMIADTESFLSDEIDRPAKSWRLDSAARPGSNRDSPRPHVSARSNAETASGTYGTEPRELSSRWMCR